MVPTSAPSSSHQPAPLPTPEPTLELSPLPTPNPTLHPAPFPTLVPTSRPTPQPSINYDCDFEIDLCFFVSDSSAYNGNSGWLQNAGGTQTSSSGPSIDHSIGTASGHYVYAEQKGNKATEVKARPAERLKEEVLREPSSLLDVVRP